MIDMVIHLTLLLLLAPLVPGVIGKTKAFFAGRVGPPLLQLHFDLVKLLRKRMVISRTTSWVFLAGPAVTLAATLAAALLVPLGARVAPVHFAGDIVLFAYLLALGRFFTTSAALDTGSAFEGMGAARELTFGFLAEPALFLALLALVRITGSLELSGLLSPSLTGAWHSSAPAMVVLAAGLLIVTLAESSRIPFDDPNTHLELTMIHEVMVLDHSGPALATILYGAALKLFVLGSLVVALVLPLATGSPLVDWALFVAAMLLFGVVVGVVESCMARLRLVQVPVLLIGASVLTGLGLVLSLVR
jgi:formate hydrogenlyase subunit 4